MAAAAAAGTPTQQSLVQANNQQSLNQLTQQLNGQLGGLQVQNFVQGFNPLTQQLLNQAGMHITLLVF